MAVEAVKNYSVDFQQPHKTNLKSQQSSTSVPEVDEEKSNAAKYMIGATALAAVVGLGIAGYKGKLGKGVQKLLGGAESATKKGEEIANDVQEKAKQYMVDGKPFTGVRNTPKARITYEDGYITGSKLSDGTVKDYVRDANGFIENISVEKPDEYTLKLWKENDGTIRKTKELHSGSPDFKLASGRENNHFGVSIEYDTTITPDGNIRKVKTEHYPLSKGYIKKVKNGYDPFDMEYESLFIKREIDLVSGKSKISRDSSIQEYELPRSLRPHIKGKWDGHKVIDGKKYSVCYDDHGKISSACHGSYNPETGVITKKYYEMQDGNLVPTKTEQIDKKTKLMLILNEKSCDVRLILGDNLDMLRTFGVAEICDGGIIKSIIRGQDLKFDMSNIYLGR